MKRILASVLKAAAFGATLGLGFVPSLASAGNASAPVPVSLDVQAICTITSPESLNFFNYDGTANAYAQNNIADVNCTQGAPYSIVLGNGAQPLSAAGYPQMASGGHSADPNGGLLSYQVFHDAAHSSPWDGPGAVPLNGVGIGSVQHYVGYGVIMSGQKYFVGSYGDTVVNTVELAGGGV